VEEREEERRGEERERKGKDARESECERSQKRSISSLYYKSGADFKSPCCIAVAGICLYLHVCIHVGVYVCLYACMYICE